MSQWVSEEFERNGRSVQVVDSVLRLSVGEGRLGANHRLGEEGVDDLSVRGHFPDDRERKTLDVRLQRAQICGDGAMVRAALEEGIFQERRTCSQERRQHVDSTIAEIDGCASCRSFIVNGSVGLDEVRDIGDVYAHLTERNTERERRVFS